MTARRFRQLMTGLSGTIEGAHMGHADFRLDGRVFGSLDKDEQWASVHLTPSDQQRFIDTSPDVFVPASGTWGLRGWTRIALARADEESVGEALTCAWQQARVLGGTRPRPASAVRRASRTSAVATPRSAPAVRASSRARTAVARPVVKEKPVVKKGESRKGTSSGVAEVDAFLAATPDTVRPILEKIRGLVRKVAPKAEEVISYRMPAFRLHGMLIYYAPFKAHIGIFPPVKGDAELEAALAPYRGPKGNLRFPLDAPIPYPLIRRVVQARLAEQRAR